MRVYKFLNSHFAMKDIWERRIKISEISDLNDPFELIPCDLSDPRHLHAVLATRDEMTRNRGLLHFSRSWANPLLWAHYGDKHRGMCLGFDLAWVNSLVGRLERSAQFQLIEPAITELFLVIPAPRNQPGH